MLSGFKIGHCDPALTVPCGAKAVMDADGLKLNIVESVVK
jgi:muramoyltetrapeptide carboxypeptidase LdcA involved in peptidoglycan recycling